MTQRSKDIGTATETAVVNYLRANGFPHAERRALHGSVDLGDITGTPGVAWEVKGGKAAEAASRGQILLWLQETEAERQNSESTFGVLVVKRRGVGSTRTGSWAAWTWADPMRSDWDEKLFEVGYHWPEDGAFPICMDLSDMVTALRTWGYGEPL